MSYRIKDLPDDDTRRVVIAFGPVAREMPAGSLMAEVVMRPINKDGTLGKKKEEKKCNVAITSLNRVRIGTIWKGREETGEIWEEWKKNFPQVKNVFTDRIFHIDLQSDAPESVLFLEIAKEEGKKKKYKMVENDPDTEGEIHYSSYTKFKMKISGEEAYILIPSLEILVSTYTPNNVKITNDLVSYDIKKALASHGECLEDGSRKVRLKTRTRYREETTACLASLLCNKKSRNLASWIWESQSAWKSADHPSGIHPIIYPYGPETFEIEASGIVVDVDFIDRKVYLVHRIEKYIPSLPFEIDLVVERTRGNSEGWQEESNISVPAPSDSEIGEEVLVDAERDPSLSQGVRYTETRVEIDTSGLFIKYREDVRDGKGSGRRRSLEPEEEAEAVSPGSPTSSQESADVGRERHVPPGKKDRESEDGEDKESEESCESFLCWTENLYKKLKELQQEENRILDVECLGKDRKWHPYRRYSFFPEEKVLDGKEIKNRWALIGSAKKVKADEDGREKIVATIRKVFVVRIRFAEKAPLYIMEIEPKNEKEKLARLVFTLKDEKSNGISGALDAVMKMEGVFFGSDWKKEYSAKSPFDRSRGWKHGKNLENGVRRIVKKYLDGSLFG